MTLETASDAEIERNLTAARAFAEILGDMHRFSVLPALTTAIIAAVNDPDKSIITQTDANQRKIAQPDAQVLSRPSGKAPANPIISALDAFGRAPADIQLRTGSDLLKAINFSDNEIKEWSQYFHKDSQDTARSRDFASLVMDKLGDIQKEPAQRIVQPPKVKIFAEVIGEESANQRRGR